MKTNFNSFNFKISKTLIALLMCHIISTSQSWAANEFLVPGGPYVIPVVWHVNHSSTLGNISDATIEAELNALTSKFQSAMGTTSISFKLAKIDPNGYCSTGILRYQSTTPWGGRGTVYHSSLVSGKQWDNSRYLNIYSVTEMRLSNGNPDPSTSGYVTQMICEPTAGSSYSGFTCQVPGGSNSTFNLSNDNIVIKYNELSSLVHEVGHWLGLFHTWGPEGGSSSYPWWIQCGTGTTNGDFIADTNPMLPTTSSTNCNTTVSCSPSIAPLSNYMSNSVSCWNTFTLGQGTRIKSILDNDRSLIHSAANVAAKGANNFVTTNVISSNTTWTTANLPNSGIVRSGSITINTGATLTISNGVNITMCRNSKITINPGGRLILNGCTITADNPGWWDGIELVPSSTSTFARVDVNSGTTIRNAVIGVKSDNTANLAYPGRVFTNGATFNNNYKAILLKSASDKNFGIDQLYNTTFSNSLTSGFIAFVELERVLTFKIYKCTFTNTANYTNINNAGIGIWSKSSEMSFCPDVSAYNDGSCGNTFNKLGYGVRIESPFSQKFNNIHVGIFTNCVYGVYCLNTSSGRFTFNIFNLTTAPYSGTNIYGIYIDGGNNSSIQENNFSGSSYNPASSDKKVGIYHNSTLEVNKFVRRNTFSNLHISAEAKLTNATNGQTYFGLRYACNSFGASTKDIFPSTSLFANTIAKTQLSLQNFTSIRAAQNTFTNSGGLYKSIDNLMSIPIDYYLRPGFPNEVPVNSPNVNQVQNSFSYCEQEEFCFTCATAVGGGTGSLSLPPDLTILDEVLQSGLADRTKGISEFKDKTNTEIQIDQAVEKMISLYYLSDDKKDHSQQIIDLLHKVDKFGSDFWLLKEYIHLQNWSVADALMQKIVNKYDNEETNSISKVYEIVAKKEALSKEDILRLEAIAGTYQGNGAYWAQSILSMYGYLYHPMQNGYDTEQRSIQNNEEDNFNVQVYPNPVSDFLYLNNILFKENTVIHIYDSVGRQVMNTTINEKQINVASLSSGIYIFDITNGKSIVGKGSFVKM
ncbi:MAG TPA: zinc-dependent metalloprotease [Saprospiraceae bacterium]|jgi:hypothetical protein|nr:zinc-dependent metalloprotease [Saprospiraceae bacterium]HMT68568.1 zinc-dependent metalloprotease [Saprospiraceae bacterium]